LNVGSLFAGIGGFDLGFERAGMHTAWQVEKNAYCRAVLAQHFPDAERFEDVRDVGAHNLAPVDLICGGFPCQDLSAAGKGAGIDGARSGLWSEFARIVRELRPRYVVVENVPDLLAGRGKRWDRAPIGRVLGDLSESGYDAEWACLSAAEFGAPHLRERAWLVAYPTSDELWQQPGRRDGASGSRPALTGVDGTSRVLAHSNRSRLGSEQQDVHGRQPDALGSDSKLANHDAGEALPRHWATEPNVGRVADGVPHRVDRLAALGNALVPQIAEWIGRRILEFERGGLA
jgi:DNA (cytosine-5)-methyltransferase 1